MLTLLFMQSLHSLGFDYDVQGLSDLDFEGEYPQPSFHAFYNFGNGSDSFQRFTKQRKTLTEAPS